MVIQLQIIVMIAFEMNKFWGYYGLIEAYRPIHYLLANGANDHGTL